MKIALWQTTPRSSIDIALKALTMAAQGAADDRADILVTPEMFIGGYNVGADTVVAHAAQAAGVLNSLQEIARSHRITLVVGLPAPADPRPRNTSVIIDQDGNVLGAYSKTHLFGSVDQEQFMAGDTLSDVVTLNGWRVGMAICYDVEFPELVRALALKGAELILVPTANMTPFDSVATRLVPARAEENAVFVAYCNYIGAEGSFTYNGLSCICGPDGADLARANEASVDVVCATITRQQLSITRQNYTHLRDRRDDLY